MPLWRFLINFRTGRGTGRYEVREMRKDLILLHVAGHLITQTQLVASGHKHEQDITYASARFISSDLTPLVGLEALGSEQLH